MWSWAGLLDLIMRKSLSIVRWQLESELQEETMEESFSGDEKLPCFSARVRFHARSASGI